MCLQPGCVFDMKLSPLDKTITTFKILEVGVIYVKGKYGREYKAVVLRRKVGDAAYMQEPENWEAPWLSLEDKYINVHTHIHTLFLSLSLSFSLFICVPHRLAVSVFLCSLSVCLAACVYFPTRVHQVVRQGGTV